MVAANGKEIALFNVGGAFYAIENTCPHRGGPLGMGFVQDCLVACPWHAWTFDVRTGASTVSASFNLEKYEVRVQGDEVLVRA